MDEWRDISEAFAFVGNSLLEPMSKTGDIALDPSFWRRFPTFGNPGVGEATEACEQWALKASSSPDPVRATSAEFAKLFLGPPRPAAAPWETLYVEGNDGYGFGKPTFEMRDLLRSSGVALSNANNQYEDHMGIELLYLSLLCSGAAEGNADAEGQARSFALAHPLAWIGQLQEKVNEAIPSGYIACLLGLAHALLDCLCSDTFA